MEFKCKRCGWCCENIVINVSYSDIVGWHRKNRWDILNEVAWINNYPKKDTGGFYITKTTLNPKKFCPFLRKQNNITSCSIQDVKPVACRDAPMGYGKFDGCKGFVQSDDKTRQRIMDRHDKDFKEAFDKHMFLLQFLAKAREMVRNG